MVRFISIFAGIISVYFLLTLTLEFQNTDAIARHPVVSRLVTAQHAVRRNVIAPYQQSIAATTAKVVNLLGYKTSVTGTEIRSKEFAVTITYGCDGIELTLLLAAGILAFPSDARRKLIGLAAGIAVIAGLNLVRVVCLWMVGVHWRSGFDIAHFGVWPFLLLCATMIFFVGWLRYAATGPLLLIHRRR